MTRFFNTAGPCRPELHYMIPPVARLPEIPRLIERESFFVVHAPRQSGKTTLFRRLAQDLDAEGRCTALHLSCEVAQAAGNDIDRGVQALLLALWTQGERLPEDRRPPALEPFESIAGEYRLRRFLTAWSRRSPRPLVLFFDEVDSLRGETLLSVLRQLRDGYVDRPADFPQSIALIGLRDVRDYRVHLREDRETLGTASPFNVKVESLLLPNFTAEEVTALYRQHTEEAGQIVTPEAAARAYQLTAGQPWLVNALAREATEDLRPDPTLPVDLETIEKAKDRLILRRDCHLDSLVDRLREARVQKVLEPILAGSLVSPDVFDDDLQFVRDLGLVRDGPGGLEIANPIYHEVIPRALSGIAESTMPIERKQFIDARGHLDFDKVLEEFERFWCENADFLLARQPYSEAAAQLIFMAFLQKIVNGGGLIDREYGVGSGRIDLLLRWPGPEGLERHAVELKVWREGQKDPLAAGLEQLSGYLGRLGLSRGVLILFDHRKNATPLPQRCRRMRQEVGGYQIDVQRL